MYVESSALLSLNVSMGNSSWSAEVDTVGRQLLTRRQTPVLFDLLVLLELRLLGRSLLGVLLVVGVNDHRSALVDRLLAASAGSLLHAVAQEQRACGPCKALLSEPATAVETASLQPSSPKSSPRAPAHDLPLHVR